MAVNLQRQAEFEGRSKRIDYDRVDQLFYVGNYRRRLPVSLNRMMENAYDWEHLPFVHPSTFHDISLIDQGDWGWRAEVGSAKSEGGDRSLLELLVDLQNYYWATTVVYGAGKGAEIHTKAVALSENQIEIEVRFYLPRRVNWLRKKLSHLYIKNQYRTLYDEDEQLMQDRQAALNDKKLWRDQETTQQEPLLVGKLTELDQNKTYVVEAAKGRYCAAFVQGQWRAYSAVCPHQLGKLDAAEVDEHGQISCPWHGYRFDVISGESLGNACSNLGIITPEEKDGYLYINPN